MFEKHIEYPVSSGVIHLFRGKQPLFVPAATISREEADALKTQIENATVTIKVLQEAVAELAKVHIALAGQPLSITRVRPPTFEPLTAKLLEVLEQAEYVKKDVSHGHYSLAIEPTDKVVEILEELGVEI